MFQMWVAVAALIQFQLKAGQQGSLLAWLSCNWYLHIMRGTVSDQRGDSS